MKAAAAAADAGTRAPSALRRHDRRVVTDHPPGALPPYDLAHLATPPVLARPERDPRLRSRSAGCSIRSSAATRPRRSTDPPRSRNADEQDPNQVADEQDVRQRSRWIRDRSGRSARPRACSTTRDGFFGSTRRGGARPPVHRSGSSRAPVCPRRSRPGMTLAETSVACSPVSRSTTRGGKSISSAARRKPARLLPLTNGITMSTPASANRRAAMMS